MQAMALPKTTSRAQCRVIQRLLCRDEYLAVQPLYILNCR